MIQISYTCFLSTSNTLVQLSSPFRYPLTLPAISYYFCKNIFCQVPPKEMKKLLPLAMMFFCVLFNYTILRNTKVLHAQDEHIIFRFAFL